MEQTKVNNVFVQYKNLVLEQDHNALRNALEQAPDEAYERVISVPTKDPTVTLLLAIFLGGLGVDRFYIGDVGLGVCKLLFGWITLGIWPLVDIFVSYRTAKSKNFREILAAL